MKRRSAVKGRLSKIASIVLVGILLNLPVRGGVSLARAQAGPEQAAPASFSWEYRLDFTAASAASASQQARSVMPGLKGQGVSASLQAAGGEQYRLVMDGSQGIEQMRQVLFSPLLAGFLGGPVEAELALPLNGQDITLRLESNLSTGYSWEVEANGTSGLAQTGSPELITRSGGYGAPGAQVLVLHPITSGTGIVQLAYRRPFGPAETATRHLRMTFVVPTSMIDLSNPHPKIIASGPGPGEASGSKRPFSAQPRDSSLPASLDWRAAGIVLPVRNQGSCGSCWAFGTVGIMESAIAKIGGPLTDLSEQFLLSCNTSGWNCADGGLTAHMWHYDLLGKSQDSIGAVLEADMPYLASDETCSVDYNHPYKLSGWQFIVPYEWMMPTVEQIKYAIATHGPVTAGVCAGPAFQRYNGGIFTTDENCSGWTNHQIILVGWQDTSEAEGYWILRNSWGSWWGENGYMRIAYNTSRVGEGTSWVEWGYRYYFPWVSR